MKKFLTKILVFAIFLIIGAFASDYMISKGLRKSGRASLQTWNEIFNSNINANTIIIGSSRAGEHYNPKILDSLLKINSYNLGIDGYDFNMAYTRLKVYEKYNGKPQSLIINADFDCLKYVPGAFKRYQFLPYLSEYLLQKELKTNIAFSKSDFCMPAVKYEGEYPAIILGISEFLNIFHISPERYKGYHARREKWNGNFLNKILLSGRSLHAEIDTLIVAKLDSLLFYCKQNDIKVVMVCSPQYYKKTDITENKEEIINIYHLFSNKYNFPFIDYSTDSLCYDTTYFYNAMHLNKKGAEIFSTKLAHDIDSLGILK